MVKVLSIGLGGVGTVAAYTLNLNEDVEVTAVIRSDYDVVVSTGYSIDSVDYGTVTGYRPNNVVKDLAGAAEHGPFDYIVVSTKVLPGAGRSDIWLDVIAQDSLFKDNRQTLVVLIQNGIDIETYWAPIADKVRLISGVSYISSINTKGSVVQSAQDEVKFGYFDVNETTTEPLDTFVRLYSSDKNAVSVDTNVRYTRWRKLLYNGTFNTVCCVSNSGVGDVYNASDAIDGKILANLILPMMKEVQAVANEDLLKNYNSSQLILDTDVSNMDRFTREVDAPSNYQPSMLVDFRSGRLIELDVILGNLLNNAAKVGVPAPNLTTVYYLLVLVQQRLKAGK